MAATNYTYSIATDTASGAVHPRSLDAEIRASAIVTALEGITTGGDVLTVTMKDSLSAGDESTLDGIVGAHTGTVTAATPPPTTTKGVPLFQTDWREGTATDFITFNWCDKTTWYAASTRVTDEVLTEDTATQFSSANPFWICVTCGKVSQEHRLQADHGAVITVDDVAVTESSPGTTDADYQIDYATGIVTFNASQTGKTVKATYSYATTADFYVEPATDTTVRLTAVEVQFSDDIGLTDSVRFDIEGYIHSFVPGTTVDDVSPDYVTSFPTGFRIALGSPRIYKTMKDYIAEAQRAYPVIPALGGGSWRGMTKPIYVMRWPYQEDATRDLVAAKGMRIKISLVNNVPFTGDYAVATLYAVSTNG